jgi:hypothetical protein
MFIAQIIPLMLIRKQTAMCIAQIVCLTLIRKQTAMCNAQIATSGAGTAYPSKAPELTPGFYWDLCYLIFSCMCNVL